MAKTFVFRKNHMIGAAAAESDEHFLSRCFVDTGDLEVIQNCSDPRNIVVGRTGSGKSALLLRLCLEQDHAIQISPESLALSYIANSNVLRFFSEAGVKMDIFYRLLWRHVFCVEVLKERFRIDSEERKKGFLDKLWQIIPKNKQDEMALDYLREWGESFWKDTEYRIKEVTTKLERELQGAVEGKLPGPITLNAAAARKLTEEQREDVIHRAQDVVNRVQIRELSNVIKLLDKTLLDDRKQKHYIVIDKLDEDWVEDSLRFRLMRALIETSVEFSRIENLKVIVAVRSDLLDRVYRATRDAGFQEEKFQSNCLNIAWSRPHLVQLLDRRIDQLVKDQYTTKSVTHKDMLPPRIGKQAALDYMLDRTLMRPRDVIQFFNSCIITSNGKPSVTVTTLREAEGQYSRDRLKALFDEWSGLYPNLSRYFGLLKAKGQIFSVDAITLDAIQENVLQTLVSGQAQPGLDLQSMQDAFDGRIDFLDWRTEMVFLFYRVGLVGLKIDAQSPFSWSHLMGISVSSAEINEDTKIQVHKTFWRVLGITDNES